MSFGNDKQMFDVDVDCAKCGTHITQLPFQPTGDRPVYCADCNRAYHESKRQDGGARQMFSVNITCAGCGAKITQLPFQPSSDKPIYCRDCMQARRNA